MKYLLYKCKIGNFSDEEIEEIEDYIEGLLERGMQEYKPIQTGNGTGWWWPIGADESGKPYSTNITSPFGARWGSIHEAIDIGVAKGTPVIATRDGVVIDLKDGEGDGAFDKSYLDKANFIIILHNDGTQSKYLHLQKGLLVSRRTNCNARSSNCIFRK